MERVNSMPMDEALADAQAVRAIREGDRERYRELVERYADKVYAVAWCRLGDPALAEEAAQEAFIAGFTRLALLRQAERFGAWITSITRNASINLGLRHRHELKRRERWALEQGVESEQDAGSDPGVVSDAGERETGERVDTLRLALAELPSGHRESLVLFYLEGKSVAEAAAAAGVTEGTFKVRLHRARQALRERLEEKLEAGLGQLRAPTRMAQAVMLALPSAPMGGWMGAGLGSLLAKVLPGGLLMAVVQVVALVPGALLAVWMGRREEQNFRDPSGFRASIYRRVVGRIFLMIVSVTLAIGIATVWFGPRGFALGFGLVLLVVVSEQLWRCLRFGDWKAAGIAAVSVLLVVGLVGVGLFHWPYWVMSLLQIGFFVGVSFLIPAVPPRMDLSLFLRAQNGLMPAGPNEATPEQTTASAPARPDWRRDAWSLAKFLGSERVVEDWKWSRSGLRLRLARVTPSPLASMIPFYWGSTSQLQLGEDGTVEAKLGWVDRRDLERGAMGSPATLERRVAAGVSKAWAAWRRGEVQEASRWLGKQPEEEIFRKPFARSPVTRMRVWMLRGVSVFLLVMLVVQQRWMSTSSEVHQARWMVPAQVDDADVRKFLSSLAPSTDSPANAVARKTWEIVLRLAPRLPGRAYFSEEARQRAVGSVTEFLQRFGTNGATGWLSTLFDDVGRLNVLNSDLLSAEDLAALDITGARLRQELGATQASDAGEMWARWTRLEEGRGRYGSVEATCRIVFGNFLAGRLRLLQRLDCLDLVDFTQTVRQLKATQIVPANSLEGLWPMAKEDRELLNGLFVLRMGDVLHDTCDALTILHLAGALDQIDREACIGGILRLHDGEGRFAARKSVPGLQVRGEASNAFAAYESLRLLGALDRVPDLAKWEFRVPPTQRSSREDRRAGRLNYQELEAWTLGSIVGESNRAFFAERIR